ncbi:uncharacterized protein [Magallana gigas]|uniref:uncharacterized protein isoform X15 n=1 Tax=Magallana gigas TaxID=29159 RepID=UPI00148ACFD4|nr:uncharacterized protein LOC117680643 isoform X8 [Crassostrea gigas]
MLHRTIFSARSVSVFLGTTLLFYVALIGTVMDQLKLSKLRVNFTELHGLGKGPINMIKNLSMQSLFCLSDPKPIHLTEISQKRSWNRFIRK